MCFDLADLERQHKEWVDRCVKLDTEKDTELSRRACIISIEIAAIADAIMRRKDEAIIPVDFSQAKV